MKLLCTTTTLILSMMLNLSASQKCLETNGGGPQTYKPCVFPFRLRGTVYNECTSDTEISGKKWCSTEVDSSGEHKKGQWGFCDLSKLPFK